MLFLTISHPTYAKVFLSAVLSNQNALCSHKALSVQNLFLCFYTVSFIHGGFSCLSTHLKTPHSLLPPNDAPFSCSSPPSPFMAQLYSWGSFTFLQICETSDWTCKKVNHESELMFRNKTFKNVYPKVH